MDLNKLRDEAFETAKAHGWHDEEYSNEHFLMLIITEIAEAVQADRKDKHADVAKFKEYQTYYGTFLPSEEIRTIRFREDFEAYIKNSVEDELSDVVIRCLDLAGLRGINLSYERRFKEKTSKFIPFPVFAYLLTSIAANQLYNLKFILSGLIGNIIIYCRQNNIDIEFFIEQKMRYNRLREYKHGNKKY